MVGINRKKCGVQYLGSQSKREEGVEMHVPVFDTVEPPINPEKRNGPLERTIIMYISNLQSEDNLSANGKVAGPQVSSIWRFYNHVK